ncbi:hypothetical protein [Ruminococcus sp.]|uniref:hypothetical protein n=1 Tax=Ruminococcus sp. TaxID=41978 RepID=UPI0025E663EB|nr:hypothetical protein [Ruminococcus sp.]MBQ8966838.1 hypothetical protein [Ruminococcus sp.]
MAEKLPDIVIKNALLTAGKTDIEITDGFITRVGASAEKGVRCTLDGAGLSVEAGQIFFCRDSFSFNGEDLLFSGYSTVIFRQTAMSPPVSELFKTAMSAPLNFAVISACKRSELPYDDGTLSAAQADLIAGHIGSLEVGMAADIFFRDSNGRVEKIIKGGKLIFDRSLTDRHDIIYTMAGPLHSTFFTTRSAAEGYIGQKLRGERRITAIV